MKIFTNVHTRKIIITILILLLLFTFTTPNYVRASVAEVGGTLISPVKQLLAAISDALLYAAQFVVIDDTKYISFYVIPKYDGGPDVDAWDDWGDDKTVFPGYLVLTPEAIFGNKISILNPDFINPIDTTDKMDGTKYKSSLESLRTVIANWYIGLRNLALVGLLSVLVYVGIRIILSSTAGEKAKYKQMIQYWLTSLVLLFVLQYIMSFTFLITKQLTNILLGQCGESSLVPLDLSGDGTYNFDDEGFTIDDGGGETTAYGTFLTNHYGASASAALYTNPNINKIANLSQYARLYSNLVGIKGITYLIIYIALIGYTVFFFIVYTARVIKMAFLTIIAPLITLTYAIDKISDGQSQAFNMWLKEFIYNALIQPFHLLIYTILIGMAVELANKNPIYSIVALAFILPAEKMMKKMFGFDKAPSAGAFSGAAAGSMVSSALSKAGNKSGGGKSGSEGGKDGDTGKSGQKPTRTINDTLGAYGEGGNGDENDEGNNPKGDKKSRQALQDADNEKLGQENSEKSGPENPDEKSNEDLIKEHEEQALEARQQAKEAELGDDSEAAIAHNAEARQHEEEAKKLRKQQQKEELGEQPETQQKKQPEKLTAKKGHGIKAKLATARANNRRGIAAVAGSAKRGIQNKVGFVPGAGKWKNFKNIGGKAAISGARGAARLGLKTAIGGATALAAFSAAAISGDPKAALGAGLLGARTGSKIGGKLADKSKSKLESVSDTFNRGKLRH